MLLVRHIFYYNVPSKYILSAIEKNIFSQTIKTLSFWLKIESWRVAISNFSVAAGAAKSFPNYEKLVLKGGVRWGLLRAVFLIVSFALQTCLAKALF